MTRLSIVAVIMALSATPVAAQVDSGLSTVARTSGTLSPGWLGMGLSCGNCSFQSRGREGGRWSFPELPSVFSVDPGGPADRAGLRPGDTLLSIDGRTLTSREGGAAFGGVRPGQQVTLAYRRDGREREVRLTAVAHPMREESRALAEQVATLMRAREREAERAQREIEASQRQIEAAQRQVEARSRFLEQLSVEVDRIQAQGQVADSARLERLQGQLDSAVATLRAAEAAMAHAVPALPSPAALPAMPAAPLPPVAVEAVPAAPLAPLPPAAWHREAGPLRYSGRLGNVIIEARGSSPVTTTEISDSEVVVTARDVSVRIALRPRAAPAARPAQPARPARPPQD